MPFERYADDIICHCNSQAEADALRAQLEARLTACRLELHPEKTRVVYCADAIPPRHSPAPVPAGSHLPARGPCHCALDAAQWVGECGMQLQPLVDALAAELLRHDVLHADETPVAMLKPGIGKTHRAYLWSYCTTQFNPVQGVVFDFAESRGGQHVRDFLQLGTGAKPGWRGKLVTDDFSGYKPCFELGVTEVGCMAHARRKFHELWANNASAVGEQALKFFGELYGVEREAAGADSAGRLELRRRRSRPVADAFHRWMRLQRQTIPNGSATAKAVDYSLKRWDALTRFLEDGDLPIDNNWVENRIRPIALGRQNWLFAGSLRAGKRAAAVMSLIHSAKLNEHDPYVYMRDILTRLPTQPASRIEELLPHHWQLS